MNSTFRTLLVLCTVSVLGACASTPDPAKVCSAEWISARSDKAVGKIENRAKSSISALTKASKTVSSGKTPGLFQKLALFNALTKLKKELTNGQGIKDLKTVAKTCNDPEIIGKSMKSLMQRQGMTDGFIRKIENNPIYQSVISSIVEPDPVTPNG